MSIYRFILLFVVVCCGFGVRSAVAVDPAPAALEQVSRSKEWLQLLHYEQMFGFLPQRSLVDDPKFFFAEDGANDPLAELLASIAAYRSPAAQGDGHPQCRFPARYRYLMDVFPELRSPAAPVSCPRLEEWMKELDPGRLTLVFPSSYLNNPASLYGHTLLRVDARSLGKDGSILGYGINYAANADENEGVLFAVKGLLGGYEGYFSIFPYYVQLARYSDIESRDIWEYETNFTPAEIERLLHHLWELRGTYFDYYFFDENCAYHLLSLLEVGRPGIELTDQFPLWVIPSDTVKAVVETPNVVISEQYRPSSGTILRERAKRNPELLGRASELLESKNVGDEQDPATILLALSLLDYRVASGKISPDAANKLRRDLHSRLSKLPALPDEERLSAAPPQSGHGSRRIGVSFGANDDDLFSRLDLRAAYHGILDAPQGFPKGSEIEFFRVSGRLKERDGFELERFVPVSIFSLTPRDEVFQPLSWSFAFGLDRLPTRSNSFSGFMSGGPGVSYQLTSSVTAFALSNFELELSEEHDQRFIGGLGAKAGLLLNVGEHTRSLIMLQGLAFVLQAEESEGRISYEQQFDLSENAALFGLLQSSYRKDQTEAQLEFGLRVFF